MGKRGIKPIDHRVEDGVELKYCRTCAEWKELGNFPPQKKTTDGLKSQCHSCTNRKRKNRRASKSETELEDIREKERIKSNAYYAKSEKSRKTKRAYEKRKRAELNAIGAFCHSCNTRKNLTEFTTGSKFCDLCQKAKDERAATKARNKIERAKRGVLNRQRKAEKQGRILVAKVAREAYKLTEEYALHKKAMKDAGERRRLKRRKARVNGIDKDSEEYKMIAERRRKHKHNRRAKERGSGGTYDPQDWLYLLELCEGKCLKCGRTHPDVEITRDHIVPLGWGSNCITNLQPYCRSDNAKKGDRYTEDGRPEWIKELIYRRAFLNLIEMMEREETGMSDEPDVKVRLFICILIDNIEYVFIVKYSQNTCQG